MPKPIVLETLEVSVQNLPPGRMRDMLLPRVEKPAQAIIQVVVLEQWGSVAAYAGYPRLEELREKSRTVQMQYHCSEIHTQEQVIKLGNRLSTKEAQWLFPRLADRIGK